MAAACVDKTYIYSDLRKLTLEPHSVQKTSWADDVEDLGEHFCSLSHQQTHRFPDQSKGEDYTDENGIRTIVEYTVNEEGKKVKVRRGRSTSSLAPLTIRPDNKKNQANSAKVAGGARRSRAKNMGQVWA
jgi:hypothetical protein